MNWNLRYATEELLNFYRRGLTSFHGTKENPTGNTVGEETQDGSSHIVARDSSGNMLGYRTFERGNGTLLGHMIENTSGTPGVGTSIDHHTAQILNNEGREFRGNIADLSTDRQGRTPEEYHQRAGREIVPGGLINGLTWPKQNVKNIASLAAGPQ